MRVLRWSWKETKQRQRDGEAWENTTDGPWMKRVVVPVQASKKTWRIRENRLLSELRQMFVERHDRVIPVSVVHCYAARRWVKDEAQTSRTCQRGLWKQPTSVLLLLLHSKSSPISSLLQLCSKKWRHSHKTKSNSIWADTQAKNPIKLLSKTDGNQLIEIVVNQIAVKETKLFYGAPLVHPLPLAIMLGMVGLYTHLVVQKNEIVCMFPNAAGFFLFLAYFWRLSLEDCSQCRVNINWHSPRIYLDFWLK